jgi:hypothetical protein
VCEDEWVGEETEGAVGVDRFLGRRRRREPKAEKDLDLVGGEDERKKLGRIGVGGGPRTSGVERGDRVWGSTFGGQRRRREEVGDKSRFI